ncbi:hypothetical protein KY290_012985 [Solanum tuberosum]|uniref:Uncharacterized protein n=1 Tax=Solanum tuberosum TaxID=4113 RepID=A0ABQ7VMN1_SOLTU|nr:hypothetical protein KY285_012749 [Solanum tuberosum]KAH0769004.1 hypothetical protein KY290_012985 [Solanum tuberosum]
MSNRLLFRRLRNLLAISVSSPYFYDFNALLEILGLECFRLGAFSDIIEGGRQSIVAWSLLEILFRVDTPPSNLAKWAVGTPGVGWLAWQGCPWEWAGWLGD